MQQRYTLIVGDTMTHYNTLDAAMNAFNNAILEKGKRHIALFDEEDTTYFYACDGTKVECPSMIREH